MQIINFINKAPRKIMLWTVTAGCVYEVIIRPIVYYTKYHRCLALDWKQIATIISLAAVLGICRSYDKYHKTTND